MRLTTTMALLGGALCLSLLISTPALAAGECCTRGNLAAAGAPDNTWSFELQYDYTSMETLLDGTDSVSPNTVLDDAIMNGAMEYKVPTKMIMQKYLLAANYRPAVAWRVYATLPYLINDMDMRMAMTDEMGMTMKTDMTMDTVEGFGDVTLGVVYTLLRPTSPTAGWDAAVGLGLKLPTGKNDERNDDGSMVHAMMQLGSGSWDPIFTLQGGLAAGDLSLRLNGTYHLATTGDEGYEFGDMLAVDVVARYQLGKLVRAGLGANFLHTGEDTDHDGKYTNQSSLVDNTDNTGLTALYLTPELQVAIPGTAGSLTLAWQKPIYQDVNGTQEVMDWRILASLGWAF